MKGWKILTHDYCSPIRRGPPLFDGKTFPFTTPAVKCDMSDKECAAGWNFVREIETGFRIAGFWPTGWTGTVFAVEASNAIERGNKCRAERLTLLRPATAEEIRLAILRLFATAFGDHADAMAKEQFLWYTAMARPLNDPAQVRTGLEAALTTRGLPWSLRKFPTAQDVWATQDRWATQGVWATQGAQGARAVWSARAAQDAWDAWETQAAQDAQTRHDAQDAWAVWNYMAARDALIVSFAARSGLIDMPHDYLTIGIREAYRHGLGMALPTGPNELGWAMDSGKKKET